MGTNDSVLLKLECPRLSSLARNTFCCKVSLGESLQQLFSNSTTRQRDPNLFSGRRSRLAPHWGIEVQGQLGVRQKWLEQVPGRLCWQETAINYSSR